MTELKVFYACRKNKNASKSIYKITLTIWPQYDTHYAASLVKYNLSIENL